MSEERLTKLENLVEKLTARVYALEQRVPGIRRVAKKSPTTTTRTTKIWNHPPSNDRM